ncbi:MAG: hypothetical protein ACRD5J_09185 [Nitrososphaeraceae archaeon]
MQYRIKLNLDLLGHTKIRLKLLRVGSENNNDRRRRGGEVVTVPDHGE